MHLYVGSKKYHCMVTVVLFIFHSSAVASSYYCTLHSTREIGLGLYHWYLSQSKCLYDQRSLPGWVKCGRPVLAHIEFCSLVVGEPKPQHEPVFSLWQRRRNSLSHTFIITHHHHTPPHTHHATKAVELWLQRFLQQVGRFWLRRGSRIRSGFGR